MPFEIFVIVIVAIVAGTVSGIVKQALNYKRETRGIRSSKEGSSLTTSELRRMLEEVVAEATMPLAEQVKALQHRLEDEHRLPSKPERVLPEKTPEPRGALDA